jgi:hypothetical protein
MKLGQAGNDARDIAFFDIHCRHVALYSAET